MKQNQDYKNEALAALKGNWAPAVLAVIVLYVVVGAILGPYYGYSISNALSGIKAPVPVSLSTGVCVLGFLVSWPLTIGYFNAHRSLLVAGDNRITQNMFQMGFNNWLHNVWGGFLMYVFIILWSFLFLIPGFIKSAGTCWHASLPWVSVSSGLFPTTIPPVPPSGRISRPMTRPGRHKD